MVLMQQLKLWIINRYGLSLDKVKNVNNQVVSKFITVTIAK